MKIRETRTIAAAMAGTFQPLASGISSPYPVLI